MKTDPWHSEWDWDGTHLTVWRVTGEEVDVYSIEDLKEAGVKLL
jgi:hypothetical protein